MPDDTKTARPERRRKRNGRRRRLLGDCVQEPYGDTAQWDEFVRARDHYQTVSDPVSGDPALVSEALDDMNSAYRRWCES